MGMIDFDITDNAVDKLMDVLNTLKSPPEMLRVAIQGGGCAGFQYRFDVETEQEEGDLRFEKNGAVVLIDPVSAGYLSGSVLDYESGLMESRFVLKNPHVKTTCGCGMSFTG